MTYYGETEIKKDDFGELLVENNVDNIDLQETLITDKQFAPDKRLQKFFLKLNTIILEQEVLLFSFERRSFTKREWLAKHTLTLYVCDGTRQSFGATFSCGVCLHFTTRKERW